MKHALNQDEEDCNGPSDVEPSSKRLKVSPGDDVSSSTLVQPPPSKDSHSNNDYDQSIMINRSPSTHRQAAVSQTVTTTTQHGGNQEQAATASPAESDAEEENDKYDPYCGTLNIPAAANQTLAEGSVADGSFVEDDLAEHTLDDGSLAEDAVAEEFCFPSVYIPDSEEYFEADDDWMTHVSWSWMYYVPDGTYYHVSTNTFYWYDEHSSTFTLIEGQEGEAAEAHEGAAATAEAEGEDSYQEAEGGEEEGGEDEGEGGDFLIDFAKDIEMASSEVTSDMQNKSGREDRHVTKDVLPLDVVSDTQACCVFTAIYDGHGGHGCADYCVKHLSNNLLSTFRQSRETIERKIRKKKSSKERGTTDNGYEHSADVEALKRGLLKSFQMTDQNYLSIAEKKKYTDGCTALVVLVYGPDEDGTLKVLTAHAGDCRAVLCRQFSAVRLTTDHKPEAKAERRRIEAAGGAVVYMKDVWRVTAAVGNKVLGLSTARSIGDILLKRPRELVTSAPDLRVVTVDFNRDQFVILGSDGIWNVLSDQEACQVVNNVVRHSNSPKEAADALTKLATQRGSTDDKTATVVLFSWHSQVESPEKQQD